MLKRSADSSDPRSFLQCLYVECYELTIIVFCSPDVELMSSVEKSVRAEVLERLRAGTNESSSIASFDDVAQGRVIFFVVPPPPLGVGVSSLEYKVDCL